MTPAYRDALLPVDERVEDLLGRMTLPEKVGQMLQLNAQGDLDDIVSTKLAGSILHASPEAMVRAIELAARTRLGIPLLTADDAIHGHSFWPGATIFPTQLAMACSWDAGLVERMARATAIEVSATGLHWTFSPVLCIARDLRWGRVGETFGEDPVLIAELGAAMVRGYQGAGLDDPTAVLACAKHFAGYSETQGGRDASEADISPRKLRSWFLPPFERAVREGARTFMLGYQAMDGVPITANRWLLNDVLKGEWGFTGMLVTDWDDVGRMVWEQRVCPDHTEAAAVAVRAGNDLVMTTPEFFEGAQEAVAQGLLAEDEIDAAVRRILRLKFELRPVRGPARAGGPGASGSGDRQRRARRPEPRGGQALAGPAPQRRDAAARGRAVGRPRRTCHGSRQGPDDRGHRAQRRRCRSRARRLGRRLRPDRLDAGRPPPRDGADRARRVPRRASPRTGTSGYARGADIQILVPDPAGASCPDGGARAPVFSPARHRLRRCSPRPSPLPRLRTGRWWWSATRSALIGESPFDGDPGAAGRPGRPARCARSHRHARDRRAAALQAGGAPTLGDGGGRAHRGVQPRDARRQAIAELILGVIEPTGRMPLSVPRHVGQQPVYYNQIRGQHGERYADLTQEPLFVFGEGLSVLDGRVLGPGGG